MSTENNPIQNPYDTPFSFALWLNDWSKKIAVVVTRNPYSTWDKIAKELKYSDYEEVTEYTDKLGLTEIVENLIKKHKK